MRCRWCAGASGCSCLGPLVWLLRHAQQAAASRTACGCSTRVHNGELCTVPAACMLQPRACCRQHCVAPAAANPCLLPRAYCCRRLAWVCPASLWANPSAPFFRPALNGLDLLLLGPSCLCAELPQQLSPARELLDLAARRTATALAQGGCVLVPVVSTGGAAPQSCMQAAFARRIWLLQRCPQAVRTDAAARCCLLLLPLLPLPAAAAAVAAPASNCCLCRRAVSAAGGAACGAGQLRSRCCGCAALLLVACWA